MALPQVHPIYVVGGEPDELEATVSTGDVVVWIPESSEDMIDIHFDNGSPFNATRLTAGYKGDVVGATVIATAPTKKKKPFTYTFKNKSIAADAEPEIIVDGGGGSGGPDPDGSKGPKQPGGKGRARAARKS
jgi:hypothetical protein